MIILVSDYLYSNNNIINHEMINIIKFIVNKFQSNGMNIIFKKLYNDLIANNCEIDKRMLSYIDKYVLDDIFNIVKDSEMKNDYSFDVVMQMLSIFIINGQNKFID